MQPAIGDYALIGDTRSAALISRDGAIDWLCWPRFDSPSIFARLLDEQRGGTFVIQPSVPFRSSRRYIDATNVLETTFTCEGGVVRLVDLMPVMTEEEKRTRIVPYRQILRRVEGVEGEVPMRVLFDPRPEYACVEAAISRRDGMIAAHWGPNVLTLREWRAAAPSGPWTAEGSGPPLKAGMRWDFGVAFDSHSPAVYPNVGDAATGEIERTLRFWRDWSSRLTCGSRYRDAVLRSALVLKLLTYAPSGAIVAAPTTSLPEEIGGERNWDYRYCWLRDAAFTVAAFDDCGFTVEGSAFVNWMLYATRLTHPKLQVLYDVVGEPRLEERVLEHLDGYRGSKPVRVGNGARGQFQLDVYAEVLAAVHVHLRRGGEVQLTRDARRMLRRLAEMVVERWQEPDAGIWEKRSGLEHHVHSKVMAWSALDCAEQLGVYDGGAVKEQIHRTVLERGFDVARNTFTATFGGKELDASLLWIVRAGFLPLDDPRVAGTIDAVCRELARGDLVFRYDTADTTDGLPGGEGAFLPCSFWLVAALARTGRRDEAHALFEKVMTRANDVGLYSEEIDPDSGELLGNFPQALTHIALINAATALGD